MNRKFSTLLTAAALFFAASVHADDDTIILQEGSNSGLYQLQSGDYVLSISEDEDGEDVIEMVEASSENLGETMFCVTVNSENQGQQPKYDFTNKIGKFLGLDANSVVYELEASTAGDAVLGADISGWAFSPTYTTGVVTAKIYSYYTTDSIVGLVVSGTEVQALKVSAADGTDSFSDFDLVYAEEIEIENAEDFNTIFGTQKATAGVSLTFTPDVLGTTLGNPFNDQKIYAADSDDDDYPLFILDADSNYLYVDTVYTNTIGNSNFLGYNWSDLTYAKLAKSTDYTTSDGTEYTALDLTSETLVADSIARTDLASQYYFKLTYFPSQDSLLIQVKEVITEVGSDGYFGDDDATTETDYYVSLQELVTDQTRILTVAEEQNTLISLGFGGCAAVTTDKTSVTDGVYVIKNDAGEYLAVPIYAGTYASSEAQWVTVEDVQDPTHMPAYQWVVLKNNASDASGVSPITLTNREFPDNTYSTQLYKGGSYLYATINSVSDSVAFEAVDASDATLGYKELTTDELKTNKYTFNYYHPYATDKYIAESSDGTLTVLEGMDSYTLTKVIDAAEYGYEVTSTVTARISGLAQLTRSAYVISSGSKNYNYDTESKYNMSASNDVDTVYFKENVCIDGVHYYAIIEGNASGLFAKWDGENGTEDEDYIVLTGKKAGVSDSDSNATLKAQVYSETRTSSFAIDVDSTPLYRRFNNENLGEADGTISLYFVETIRNEYLMDENNENLLSENVDYAGIWDEEKADGKLAFRVDTAWVNRGSGNVKPQYLLSAYNSEYDGETVIPCTEDGPHITADGEITDDPYECVHATTVANPSFIYGKYLVNFSDSAAYHAGETVNEFLFNTAAVSNSSYTRVGFVPAIQYGDTLIVLTDEYAEMTAAELVAEGIESILEAYAGTPYINDLTGDKHKNYTWSFRYVNPDDAGYATEEGEDNEFLFESNVYGEDDTNYQTVYGDEENAIAPEENGAWLKMHNGCLVITDATSTFSSAKTGGDGALVFNAYQKTDDIDYVTSTEEIAAETVSVVAGTGVVTIKGAAGKSVVITNILGKAVASTTLTSDSQTISVPAGIVVVAVEGEDAVKTIVK